MTAKRSLRPRIARKPPARVATKQSARLSLRTLRSRVDAGPGDLLPRVQLAEHLLRRREPDRVIELFSGGNLDSTSDHDPNLSWRARRVLAFAYALAERFEEVRGLAEQGVAAFPGALDFHYLLAYIGNRIGEDALCESHAREFLRRAESGDDDPSASEWRQTAKQVHEVCNYLGAALEKTGRDEEALAAFADAIRSRKNYDLAWANRIRLLANLGRVDEAKRALREGIRACPRSRLLPRLKFNAEVPVATRPTISLCMIVKNEEEHLPRCLASVQGLADQIVVVDTGSTDRTVEIANSFGAEVHHHAWEGNFSKARNISIGYAECDWVLILDADEEFNRADINLIRQTIAAAPLKAIVVSVYNYSAEKRMYTSFLPSIRLFRRDLGAYYDGIVHNQLRFPTPQPVLRIPARINHYGYGLAPEAMARKVARTKALLQQQLEQNLDNGFAHFNMAQLLRGEPDSLTPEKIDQVIDHAGRAVSLSSPDDPQQRHIHLMALHQMVTGLFNKADYTQAAVYAHRALAHKPDYLDAIISLGHIHSMDGQLDVAHRYYLEYLDRQKAYDEHAETDHIIMLHLRSRHNALYGLGLVAEMQGDDREAVRWFAECVAERDDYLDAHFRLAQAYSRLGNSESAQREFERELELNPDNIEGRIAYADSLADAQLYATERDILTVGLESAPDSAALRSRLANLERIEGNHDAALAHVDALPVLASSDPEIRRLRANILYDARRWDEATSIYDEILTRKPDDTDAANNLANCYFQTRDYVRAGELYRRVIDAGRAEPYVYRNLGVSLAAQGNVDDAIFTLESYIQISPEDPDVCGMLGDLHFARQDFGRALDEYEKVVERDPHRPDTLTRIGDCYLARGVISAALTGYEAALRVDPEYEPAWQRLRELRTALVAQSKVGVDPSVNVDDSPTSVETAAVASGDEP